jgi:hypothetical protein
MLSYLGRLYSIMMKNKPSNQECSIFTHYIHALYHKISHQVENFLHFLIVTSVVLITCFTYFTVQTMIRLEKKGN